MASYLLPTNKTPSDHLAGRFALTSCKSTTSISRGERIRTSDLLLPKQAVARLERFLAIAISLRLRARTTIA